MTNETVQNIENDVKAEVAEVENKLSSEAQILKEKLLSLNIEGATLANTDAEVHKLATNVITDLQAILRNSAIVIGHSIEVVESLASRGKYPEELQEGSTVYKNRPGTLHLKQVLSQILPIFAQKSPPIPGADVTWLQIMANIIDFENCLIKQKAKQYGLKEEEVLKDYTYLKECNNLDLFDHFCKMRKVFGEIIIIHRKD